MLDVYVFIVRSTNDWLMLNTHVALQTSSVTKPPLAHMAFKRFLFRVNTLVRFQMLRSTKTLLAHIAFIRFLVHVNTHVLCQSTRFTKTRLAHIAFIRFLVRVNTHVRFQMMRFTKNIFSQTSHSCPPLFLFTPFLIKAVSSSRI